VAQTPIAVAGVDAGGTKTAGLLVDLEGRVVARSLAGTGNYQGPGVAAAEAEIRAALGELEGAAREAGLRLAAVGFGISGWDRPRDEQVIRGMIERVCPEIPCVVMNDTYLILRAGALDGAGVAVVSGTGSNCVGMGRDGRLHRVGGLMNEMGDFGSGEDIGVEAIRAARRGRDGRARPTSLAARIEAHFGLTELEEIADRFISEFGMIGAPGQVAPLVFEEAAAGDPIARDILERAGAELGLSAHITASHLFRPDEPFALVMGGSVLQKGGDPTMRRRVVDEVRRLFPKVEGKVLQCEPVVGGVFLGLDLLKERGELPDGFVWPDQTLWERLTTPQ
jgi:N-acetylglucosamine kinase-like BadF-type ATPase